ncbi:unnamed protein product [Albugo candida]|uniref:Uncharacterized protein n=1 Tax=Albugo candida TaxID=65357 RepID=A0A024GMA0_9STRA|nr:unnamed protein product [Albugo candida]|eukprot:CCI47996.1 unnamed protein product [Albugo candida]
MWFSNVVESGALVDDPRLCFVAFDEFQSYRDNTFTKGVQASPDNLCLLTNSEDHTIRIFEPPIDRDCANAHSVLQIKEPGSTNDMKWYPHMNSAYPSTCCFLTTSKDQPIHLWDAYSGQVSIFLYPATSNNLPFSFAPRFGHSIVWMNSPPQRRLIPRQTNRCWFRAYDPRVRPVPSKPRFRVSAACKDEESQARIAWSDQLYSLQSTQQDRFMAQQDCMPKTRAKN